MITLGLIQVEAALLPLLIKGFFMKVAGITSEGDFIFGRGRASYKTNSDAIAQNVVTRLRLFTDDWYLDVDSGIPWIEILGARGGFDRIQRAIEKSVLQTDGVKSISRLEVEENAKTRTISVILEYVDVFNVDVSEVVDISTDNFL